MRTTSILLELVVVLGFVSEAGAAGSPNVENTDYSIRCGMQRFGFHDGMSIKPDGSVVPWSFVNLGPLGSYEVPFSATQGFVGFCVIVVAFIVLPVAATVRRRKRAAR